MNTTEAQARVEELVRTIDWIRASGSKQAMLDDLRAKIEWVEAAADSDALIEQCDTDIRTLREVTGPQKHVGKGQFLAKIK